MPFELLQVRSEMFKVFQTDWDSKQQRGDGTIPFPSPFNEALLANKNHIHGIKLPLYLLAGWFPLISFRYRCLSKSQTSPGHPHQTPSPHSPKTSISNNSQASTPPNEVALRNSFRAVGNALAAASVDNSKAKQPPKPDICLEATSRALAKEGCCTAWIKPNSTLSTAMENVTGMGKDDFGMWEMLDDKSWWRKRLKRPIIWVIALLKRLLEMQERHVWLVLSCPEFAYLKGLHGQLSFRKACTDFYHANIIKYISMLKKWQIVSIYMELNTECQKSMPKPRIFGGLL